MENQYNPGDQAKNSDQNQSEFSDKEPPGSIKDQKRSAIIPQRVPVRFQQEKPPEKLVTTFPNLIIRELICFQLVVIVVALISLFFDAPLLKIANPNNTPNPAKAPWYFSGIQELLHSFPSIIGGVIIPVLVIIALLAIPYVNINIKQKGLWLHHRHRTMIILSFVTFVLIAISLFYHALSIVIPTLLLYGIAIIPYFFHREKRRINWLARRSLAEWIMTWFVVVVSILTIIGIFFRGPEWKWALPWK